MNSKRRRIGIFSGTFDPVHKGHVAFALQALEAAELDMVYFAPEVKPRRKPDVTHIGHRLAMLKLATRPYKQLAVLEFPDKYFSAKSTLPKLQQKFPGDQLVMLLGSDLFDHLPSWPQVELLLSKVGLVIGVRGGHETAEALKTAHGLPVQPQSLQIIDSVERTVSSGLIREIVQAGKTSHDLVPSVQKYIEQEWLYQSITRVRSKA